MGLAGRNIDYGDGDGDDGGDGDGDGEEGSGWVWQGGILFASQGSKAQNCTELVAPNIQRISWFHKFIILTCFSMLSNLHTKLEALYAQIKSLLMRMDMMMTR